MKVLVTGGSGFVGDHIVRRLVADGFAVRVASRTRPRSLPQDVDHVVGDVAERGSVTAAVEGVDALVHLTAIIVERGSQTFERVNHQGTRNVIDAMRDRGVERIVHMSALGASPDERFPYLRSKWLAEEAVRAGGLKWTILRPSVLHGEGAGFFRPIVWSLRWAPVYPMVARGRNRFQPLWIEDLARGIVACLRGAAENQTLDLGGPEVLTFSDIVNLVMDALGKRRRTVSLPVWAARPFAAVQGLRREPLVTNQQLDMVVLDNTCALDSVERAFGFRPKRMVETDLRWLAKL
jgi:NADH dehydrogenase